MADHKPLTKKANTQGKRASNRERPPTIEAGDVALLRLMTEQCKTESGYSTFYVGSRQDFEAATVPAALIPVDQSKTKFRCEPGGQWVAGGGLVEGRIKPKGDQFELEVRWGFTGPYLCAHPALTAIARDLANRLRSLTQRLTSPCGASSIPTVKLAELSKAVDADKCCDFSPEFSDWLRGPLRDMMWRQVLNGEVTPPTHIKTPEDREREAEKFRNLVGSFFLMKPVAEEVLHG